MYCISEKIYNFVLGVLFNVTSKESHLTVAVFIYYLFHTSHRSQANKLILAVSGYHGTQHLHLSC